MDASKVYRYLRRHFLFFGVALPTVVFQRLGLKSINRRLSMRNDRSHINS